jgi:hypothetical protein
VDVYWEYQDMDERAPAETARFYCDESGNTGANWVDPMQPIFTYAGWLVRSEAEEPILSALDALRVRHRIYGTELKWSNIGRRPDGARIFREMFELCLKNTAVPFFFVADKTFQTAGKVIETFFDPEHNHNLGSGFAGSMTAKKLLAEMLLDSPSILREFAEWHRAGIEPPAGDVKRMADELRTHFLAIGQSDVAAVLLDFTEKEIADIQHEFGAAAWLRTTTGHTLFALLQRLEGFLRQQTLTVEIVHDELVRFDDLFDMMRGLFRDADGIDTYQVEESTIFLTMPTVSGLRLANSVDEPFVQLSDLLAGFLRTIFTKLKNGTIVQPEELAVIRDLAAIHMQWYTWDANMPEELWSAFGQTAFSAIS